MAVPIGPMPNTGDDARWAPGARRERRRGGHRPHRRAAAAVPAVISWPNGDTMTVPMERQGWYVAWFEADGGLRWLHHAETVNNFGTVDFNGLAVDPVHGQIIEAGNFTSTINFTGNPGYMTSGTISTSPSATSTAVCRAASTRSASCRRRRARAASPSTARARPTCSERLAATPPATSVRSRSPARACRPGRRRSQPALALPRPPQRRRGQLRLVAELRRVARGHARHRGGGARPALRRGQLSAQRLRRRSVSARLRRRVGPALRRGEHGHRRHRRRAALGHGRRRDRERPEAESRGGGFWVLGEMALRPLAGGGQVPSGFNDGGVRTPFLGRSLDLRRPDDVLDERPDASSTARPCVRDDARRRRGAAIGGALKGRLVTQLDVQLDAGTDAGVLQKASSSAPADLWFGKLGY